MFIKNKIKLYKKAQFVYLFLFTLSFSSSSTDEISLLTNEVAVFDIPFSNFHNDFVNIVETLPYEPFSFEISQTWSDRLAPFLENLLPPSVVDSIRFCGSSYKPSLIHLKGLPRDLDIPRFECENPTDRSRRADAKTTKISEAIIHGLARLLGGELRASAEEHQGRYVHNIIPLKGEESSNSSIGKFNLDYHTDGFYSTEAPSFLILVGLEADEESENMAATSYVLSEEFIEKLDEFVILEMEKTQFAYNNRDQRVEKFENIFPLIQKEGELVRLRFFNTLEAIQGITPIAQQVLLSIHDQTKSLTMTGSIVLHPGEALIINNGWGVKKIGGVLHGRKGITKNPMRWIQRGYVYSVTCQKISGDTQN